MSEEQKPHPVDHIDRNRIAGEFILPLPEAEPEAQVEVPAPTPKRKKGGQS